MDQINFDQYQVWQQTTAFYPGIRKIGNSPTTEGLTYAVLGLTGEAGEVADKVKKILRDDGGVIRSDRRDALIKEAGDVLWYLSALCNELDTRLDHVARTNQEKINGRTERGTRQGSGDDR